MVMTRLVLYWTYSENRKANAFKLTSDLPLLRGRSRIDLVFRESIELQNQFEVLEVVGWERGVFVMVNKT